MAEGNAPETGAAAAPAATRVTVLTVDDQAVFRRAARELIAATEGFEQVGEACSGPEALEAACHLRPDIVLLDVRMPGMDGIETAGRLAARVPRALVVLISLEDVADLPSGVAAAGVAAHVRKQDLSPRALRAVWEAHATRGR